MKNYKEYLTTLDNCVNALREDGVCVIPNILTEDECITIRNKIWNQIKNIHQDRFDINDKDTWRNFYDFMPLHSMLIQHFSIAHLQGVWDVRQHPKVAEVFSKIHNVPKEDLKSSFDGISIHLPPEITNKGWFRGNDWMHTDQSPFTNQFDCVQGLVNLYPVNEYDATLTILEKSNNYHEEFFNTKDKNTLKDSDWYVLNEEDKQWFINKGCEQYCVKAPIGSIVLWDSRTMHQGIEAQKNRQNQNFRMVIYTCLRPKYKFTQKELEKRQKAFNELRITNHLGTLLFAKNPRTYGYELPEFNQIDPPLLTDLGRSLI